MAAGSKTPLQVFFYEAFKEEAAELSSLLGTNISYDYSDKTIQELGHADPPARLISIRTQSTIPIEWTEKIDGVLSRSTGYDHLVRYQSKIRKKLPLGYLEEYATRAVAEQTMLMVQALLRKLPLQLKQFGTFERDGLTGGECLGKNLLVVGVGRIGSEIITIAKGLGFVVKGVDIKRDKPAVEYVSKEEGIAWADVVVCSMNLTPENTGYFNYDYLKQSRPGCIFVNIARGEHSPISDLLQLVKERKVGGVGLDVYEDESSLAVILRNAGVNTMKSVSEIRALAAYPNVLLTPHNAFNTIDAVRRKSRMSVEQVEHFLSHKDFIWKLE